MNYFKKNELDNNKIFKSLPPLIKGYLRLGVFVGDGAVIDKQFNHIEQLIKIYGDSDSGLCKVCNYTYNTGLWRHPVLNEEIVVDIKS